MTEYYWNTENERARLYRKPADSPVDYWSPYENRWCWSQDANRRPYTIDQRPYIKLSPADAAQRAAQIGAIL